MRPMRPTAMLLGLILAGSAWPMRLAEAADDLGRALDGAGQIHLLREADGGVGDDRGDSIRSAPVGDLDGPDAPLPFAALDAADDSPAPSPRGEGHRPPPRPPSGGQRLALLCQLRC